MNFFYSLIMSTIMKRNNKETWQWFVSDCQSLTIVDHHITRCWSSSFCVIFLSYISCSLILYRAKRINLVVTLSAKHKFTQFYRKNCAVSAKVYTNVWEFICVCYFVVMFSRRIRTFDLFQAVSYSRLCGENSYSIIWAKLFVCSCVWWIK